MNRETENRDTENQDTVNETTVSHDHPAKERQTGHDGSAALAVVVLAAGLIALLVSQVI